MDGRLARHGGGPAPSPRARRALRIQFFVLVGAIACAFLIHVSVMAVTAERKLELQRFDARLSQLLDSWHQLLMTTHRMPYREDRPEESWKDGVRVFGVFRAKLEAFAQEVDREPSLDARLRGEVVDLLRGLRYGNQYIQATYDDLEAFRSKGALVRSRQCGGRSDEARPGACRNHQRQPRFVKENQH